MSKQLKDYLHLYLGCECMYLNGEAVISEISMDSRYELLCSVKLKGGKKHLQAAIEKVKPILRPLPDMTDEEKKEIDKQYKAFTKSKTFNDTGVVMWAAKHTQILLSKHFDLFGLIESGLAIDKTKTNTTE